MSYSMSAEWLLTHATLWLKTLGSGSCGLAGVGTFGQLKGFCRYKSEVCLSNQKRRGIRLRNNLEGFNEFGERFYQPAAVAIMQNQISDLQNGKPTMMCTASAAKGRAMARNRSVGRTRLNCWSSRMVNGRCGGSLPSGCRRM